MLTDVQIETLSAPFKDENVSVKIQSTNQAKDRAMLVCYLQHTDVYHRLETVDPAWQCETVDVGTYTDKREGTFHFVRMRMTVKNVSRENVGDGLDPKAAYSDAIKRCAMLFGVGRYLYDAPTVWVPYNEGTDKYKTYTMADYRAALNQRRGK